MLFPAYFFALCYIAEAFHQNFPEAADGHLERMKESSKDGGCATYVVTLQFNRPGSLIAIGCNDGRIEIWDFVTRRIAKIIVAHSHSVCYLSWSRDSRKLLSASTDNLVCMWNVVTSELEATYSFPCPVLKAQFNPRKATGILVSPIRHPPVFIDTQTGKPTIIKSDEEVDLSIAASFDRRGACIYTGNSRGNVCIYNAQTLDLVAQFRSTNSASNSAIKSIEFSRRGDFFLLNCADRFIRVYCVSDAMISKEPEPIQKLRDLVTGSHWRKCCFSGDGEYVCAGSMKQHSIYIWERVSGTLVKILHGQKGETLLDVVWHPLRPIVVSISNSSTKEQVSIWAQTQVQNWSAFAPDFKELDENVEYEERESEFDLEDDDKVEIEKQDDLEQDAFVDIETVEPVAALLSSDEEEQPLDILMFLAISPDVDVPDEQSGGEESSGNLPSVGGATGDEMAAAGGTAIGQKRLRGGQAVGHVAVGRLGGAGSAASASAPSFTIDLPNALMDEVHPLVGSSKKQQQQQQLVGKASGSLGFGGSGSSTSRGGDNSDASSTRKGRNRARKLP